MYSTWYLVPGDQRNSLLAVVGFCFRGYVSYQLPAGVYEYFRCYECFKAQARLYYVIQQGPEPSIDPVPIRRVDSDAARSVFSSSLFEGVVWSPGEVSVAQAARVACLRSVVA